MSQIWKIKDLNLELDLEDYDTAVNYQKAFENMSQEEKKLRKDGNVSEFIKGYCMIFYNFFDYLFGDGTGNKLFEGRYNARVCDEIYDSFLNFVSTQKLQAAERKKNIYSKYLPNRAAKKVKK